MASTIWRGFVTFGLISIPVRLFRAARAEKVRLRRLHKEEPTNQEAVERPLPAAAENKSRLTLVPRKSESVQELPPVLTPVKQASVKGDSAEVIPAKTVVKGFEYQKDQFVELEAEQLRAAAIETSGEMPIEEFVKLQDIDPVYFETSYYLVPDEAGEKAYALLYQSMKSSGLVALARLSMHGREHVVVIRPGSSGMLAHTMFFASEVRSDEEFRTNTAAIDEKELKLAQSLIHSLAAPFEPEKYHDTYRQRLEALIASKVEGRSEAPAAASKPMRSPVPDLTEALQRSLATLKKPAGKEPTTADESGKKVASKTKGKRAASKPA